MAACDVRLTAIPGLMSVMSLAPLSLVFILSPPTSFSIWATWYLKALLGSPPFFFSASISSRHVRQARLVRLKKAWQYLSMGLWPGPGSVWYMKAGAGGEEGG